MNYLTEISNNSLFNPIINFLTIIILAWTAMEAFRARRATAKSNELSLLPILGIYFKGEILRDRKIRIRNVGYGPAYSVKVDDYYLLFDDMQEIWKMSFSVEETNLLIPGEERDLELKNWSNGELVDNRNFMVFSLDPNGTEKLKRVSMVIRFKNAAGDNYYTVIEMGFGAVEIKKPPSKIRLADKIYLQLDTFQTSAKFGKKESLLPALLRTILKKVRVKLPK
jgi:hypothetical protein